MVGSSQAKSLLDKPFSVAYELRILNDLLERRDTYQGKAREMFSSLIERQKERVRLAQA